MSPYALAELPALHQMLVKGYGEGALPPKSLVATYLTCTTPKDEPLIAPLPAPTPPAG